MKTLRSVRDVFARSSLASFVSEAFRPRQGTAAFPARDRKSPKRQDFSLEAIEPRLLLSADVNYAADVVGGFAVERTLKIVDEGAGNLRIKLHETGNAGNVLFDAAISSGEDTVNVTRGVTGSLFQDTITIDLSTFALLAPASDALTINFSGGAQDLIKDQVILSGTASLGFGLTVNSNADILVPASASLTLTDADDNLALSVAASSSGFLNEETTGLDLEEEFDFLADADADIDVLGVLSAHDIELTATSTLTVDNSSLALGSFQIAFIYGNSSADVNIGNGADITASGALTLTAASHLYAVASLAALATQSDGDVDAALASVVLLSDAFARVEGDAAIDVTGAFQLISDNVVIGAALADGSAAGAGATLAVAVLSTNTESSIAGSATVDAASVTVKASSQNTLTALATASQGGATDDGDAGTSTNSQDALAENGASTSEGDVSIAGAVAVGTLVSSTSAFVDTAGHVTSAGLLDVTSRSVNNALTTADGSSTADGATGVGVAVAVGVTVLDNHAYVDGSGLTAGSLNVRALMSDRALTFDQAQVDDGADTIALLGGAHGLVTGDEIVYEQGDAATAIGNLADGVHYFVNVQDDGSIKLYNSAANAALGGATGLVNLLATGSPAGHSFIDASKLNRSSVTAVAGASGGDTGVAGALAIGVMISEASASIRDGTVVTITGGGNVTVSAENFIQSTATATGKQAGSGDVGVGASFALNIGETDTDAFLGTNANLLTAGDLTLSARSKNDMVTRAEGGAAGDTAVTPVIAISVSNNETQALLGTLAGTMTLGDDLVASAEHQGSVDTSAEGDTESGDTGVGISLALSIGTDLAFVSLSRNLSAGGLATLNARNVSSNASKAKASVAGGQDDAPAEGSSDADQGGVNKKTQDNRDFASNRATAEGSDSTTPTTEGASAEGEGGNKVQVAGAVAITIQDSTARATIGDGLLIDAGTAGADGVLTLKSENNTDVQAIADASTVMARTLEFDPTDSGIVSAENDTIDLGADHGFTTGDKVIYRKDPAGDPVDGLSDGDAYYLRMDGNNAKLFDTKEHAEGSGTDGLVDLDDEDPATGTAHGFEAGGGPTGTGVGIAVAVNVATVTNEAILGDSTVTADGLLIQALVPSAGGDQVNEFKAEATSGSSGADTGVAGALALNVGISRSRAAISDDASVTLSAGGDVTLTAVNDVSNTVKATGKQEGGGSIGVGASIALNIGETDTDAVIGDSVTFTSVDDVTVSAVSGNAMTTAAEGGSAGETAITPVVAISVSDNDTRAELLGGASALTLGGTLNAAAAHEGEVLTDAKGDTESGDTGVGISIALTIATDSAIATTQRDITAGGAVQFAARTVSINRSTAYASVAGGESEGEGESESSDSTDQKVGKQEGFAKDRSSANGGETSSQDKTDSASSDTSGGSVSVAGAVAVTVATSTSRASLPEFTNVIAGNGGGTGAVVLQAQNLTDAVATADGSAVTKDDGTGVGVGVAVNVGTVTNEAYIGAGSSITADGITVEATMADREVDLTTALVDVVDPSAETIFIGLGHTFKTGDKVTYQNGSGTAIGGLTDDQDYYAKVGEGGTITLYDTEEHALAGGTDGRVDLTGAGTGTGHKFEYGGLLGLGEEEIAFDAGQRRVIDLDEGHNLRTGDAVRYDNGGGATMGALADEATYYVIILDGDRAELAATREDALAGKAIKLTGAGNAAQKLVDATHSMRAEAQSGASGGDIGVAGSVAISIANVDSRAVVGYDPTPDDIADAAAVITLTGGDVDIHAVNASEASVTAEPSGVTGGAQGKSVGVGASFALNVLLADTVAEIEDGEQVSGNTGHFRVSADTVSAAMTTAENGASGGGTSVGASVAIAVVENTTRAHVGSGAGDIITLAGDLGVEASLDSTVLTTGSGTAAGKSAAVGAAVAINIVVNDTQAELESNFAGAANVDVTSTSRAVVRAESRASATGASSEDEEGNESKDSEQETDSQSDFASTRSGTSNKDVASKQSSSTTTANESSSGESGQQANSDGPAVAASIAVNYLEADTVASVASGVVIVATGDMAVRSSASADVIGLGLSTATNTNSNTGVAAAVSLNIALLTNTAEVGSSADLTAGSIAVEAVMVAGETNTFQSRALSGAASKQTAVGGSVSINYVDQDTNATVGANASLHATGGDVTVAAESLNEIQNVAGGAALSTESGGAGIGIAVALNIVTGLDTNATVGANATVQASDSITVSATSSLEPKTENLPVIGDVAVSSFAAGVAGAAGGTAVGGSSSVNVYLVETHATIEDGAQVTAGDDITVSAIDAVTLFSAAGGLAASTGNAGVGIGLDVGVITRNTTASVGAGADLVATAGDITVAAASHDTITSIAGTFGLSTSGTGVAASIAVQVLITETRAFVEDGAGTTLTAGGDVEITATADLDSLMVAGAIGGGSSAGVGVANTTFVHADTVVARIGSGNVVNSAGANGVRVEAESTEEIISITAAGAAASSVGVAVAPTINVLNETTTASVGRGATVNAQGPATGDVVVRAFDDTTIVSVAGSIGAAGSVGVAVGADVLSLIKNTTAFIDSGVTSHVDGDIDVDARSGEDITSVAAGVAVGGSAGVGVNASVHVLDLKTRAFIGDDAGGLASMGAGDVHALGTVRIAADDSTEMDKVVATVAVGGSAGVGAAATVSVIDKTTEAFIGNGASVTGDGQGAGLAAATGAFGVTFIADAAPVQASFSAGTVDTAANQVTGLAGGTLVTGDAVTYRKGTADGNKAVGGLEDGGRYFVRNDGGTVSFYHSKGNALAGDVSIDPAGAVDTAKETLTLAPSHGLSTGDRVVYQKDPAGGTDAIGGLASGQAYFVRVTGDKVSFYDSKENARDGGGTGLVNLTSAGTGTAHKLVTRIDLTGGAAGAGHTLERSDILEAQDAKGESASVLKGSGEVAAPNVGDVDTNGDDEPGGMVDAGGAGNRSLTSTTANVRGVAVSATARDDIETYSAAVGGGTVGVAVAAAVNVVNIDTKAYISDSATVNFDRTGADAAQSVLVGAGSDFHHVALAAGAGFGAVGVAPGVDVTVLALDTSATIGTNADVRAMDDVRVEAHAAEDVLMIGMGIAAGTVGVGGGVSVLSVDNTTYASILGEVTAQGDVAVASTDDTKVMMVSGALGAGFVGVGASVGVTVINKDTQAFVGDGATVSAKGAGVGGTSAFSGGLSNDDSDPGDDADGFSTATRHGLIVQAASSEELLHIGVAAGFGFVGVSGAVTVSVIDSDTQAWIGSASVNQDQITFNPVVDTFAETVALGGATGLVTGDGVTYLKGAGANTAIGGLEDGAVYYVRSTGGGNFSFYDTQAHAMAGGAVGRMNLTSAGSGSGHALGNTKAGTQQGVYVGAANEFRALTFAGAVAGGFVGVGGAVSVGVLNNDTSAQVRSGALVAAHHDIEVNALAIKEVEGVVISAAGGFVGVAGAVSVWSVGSPLQQNYSDNDEDGNTKDTANALERRTDAKEFDATSSGVVDTTHDTIGLGGAYGLSNGDAVVYQHGTAGSDIGGLTEGGTYYVNVQGNGRLKLYDTAAHAIAGGSTGVVDLTSSGTGKTHRFNADFVETADQDAAQQGENASGMVSGQLSGAFGPTPPDDPDADQTSDGRVAGIVNTGASKLGAARPSASDVAAALAAAPPVTKGTSATIASNSHTTAGGSIAVRAVEDLEIDLVAGGVAAGAVGAGAGISVVNIASNVSATAGGTLSAGGTLTVYGGLDEDVDVLALAGGAGFVGLGAAVAVVSDASTTSAGISAGATVKRAGQIDIDAVSRQTFSVLTPTVTLGAVAVGASFTKLTVDNPSSGVAETWAYIGDNAQIGQGAGVVGGVSINANSTIDATGTAFGLSVGAIAGSINFSFVDVEPTVKAEIGAGADVKTSGAIAVDADTNMAADASVQGYSGGAGALAGSFAFATLAPTVFSTLGAGAVVTTTNASTGTVRFRARHNVGQSDGATAEAIAGSGGALIGASGAVAVSDASATMETAIRGSIHAAGGVTAAGESVNIAVADTLGVGVGTVGVGLSLSSAHAGGSVSVHSDAAVTGESFTLTAEGRNTADAETYALAGGLIAAGVNYARADLDGSVQARLGSASTTTTENDILLQASATNVGKATGHGVTVGGIAVGGMVTTVAIGKDTDTQKIDEVVASMDAGATIGGGRFVNINAVSNDTAWASGQSAGGGAISVTGSLAQTQSDQTTRVNVGAGATITATSVFLQSNNLQTMDTKSEALSFGLATGAGALANNTATGDALVDIGAGAEITALNISVVAKNAFDKQHFSTNLQSASVSLGGITALLSDTDIGTESDEFEARINVGNNARLTSLGNNAEPGLLRLEAFTDVFALDKVETEAYGLLGISLGKSEVSADTRATVSVDGSTLRSAAGNVDITTRSNAYARTDTNTTIAVAISGAGGSVSVTDLETHNDIILNNANIKGRDVKLFAGRTIVGQVNIIDAYANANVQAYSLLPAIGVPIAIVTIDENNTIIVQGSTKVQALAERRTC